MASRIGKMMSQANNSLKRLVVPFGRVASGSGTMINVQNTVDSEVRELMVVSPYGVSSCPPSGLFAQMIVNGDTNNTCVGVHNPNAPQVKSGEVILYSSGDAYIKLDSDGVITIHGSRINWDVQDIGI